MLTILPAPLGNHERTTACHVKVPSTLVSITTRSAARGPNGLSLNHTGIVDQEINASKAVKNFLHKDGASRGVAHVHCSA